MAKRTGERQLDFPTKQAGAPETLAWESTGYQERKKKPSWHLAVWLIAVVVAAATLWLYQMSFQGITTALVALAAALALTMQGRRAPKATMVRIESLGVVFGEQRLVWDELKGFWLHQHDNHAVLYLETTRRWLSIVRIELSKVDPGAVRAQLLAHLPEYADRTEDLNDRLARLMRF